MSRRRRGIISEVLDVRGSESTDYGRKRKSTTLIAQEYENSLKKRREALQGESFPLLPFPSSNSSSSFSTVQPYPLLRGQLLMP